MITRYWLVAASSSSSTRMDNKNMLKVTRRLLTSATRARGKPSNNNNAHSWLRSLPKVPTTRFLETEKLATDVFYAGYRPITYPMRESPFFGRRQRLPQCIRECEESGAQSGSPSARGGAAGGCAQAGVQARARASYSALTGHNKTGGIETMGVNGAWRHNDARIPASLVPYAGWCSSYMGMQYYPEWQNVPKSVVSKLRPFDLHSNKKH